MAFVDQGYTGEAAAEQAAESGIRLEVVKHTEAKKGFVLLPRRWVVERTFGWLGRFRRLARDYERLPETLAGWHWLAFLTLLLPRLGTRKCITGSRGWGVLCHGRPGRVGDPPPGDARVHPGGPRHRAGPHGRDGRGTNPRHPPP